MTRISQLAFVFLTLVVAARADDPPILRYTSYVLVEVAGQPTRVTFESRPYGSLHTDYTYRDQPSYALLGALGQTLGEWDGQLGGETAVTVPTSAGDFALVEARPGNNYCVARPVGPYGFVATESAPLNVVRGFDKLHFLVPKGVTEASLFLHAFSKREAGRALLCDPTGKLAAEMEDDFNEPTAVSFRVPDGQDGKVWSLALVAPKNPDWVIDDCKVWLSGSLPGVLSPKPEWAERLSKPFVVEWRRAHDFEDRDTPVVAQWERPAEKATEFPAFKVGVTQEQAHSGKRSLRLEMNLGDKASQGNMLKVFVGPLEVGKVERVKFWLYGDGSVRKLTVRVRDQNNEHHYCPVGAIGWKGWGEVTADFTRGTTAVSGGDGNKRIDGPKVSVVIHLGHEPGQPTQSVYYVDDLSVSP